mgnify:FL=1
MDYKKQELKEYFNNYIEENKENVSQSFKEFSYIDNDEILNDVHHNCFNTDYYIIGTYEATKWLGDEVFNVINFIKEYENDNFGEVTTDFSSAEKVVNMYAYIIGYEIIQEWNMKDNIQSTA